MSPTWWQITARARDRRSARASDDRRARPYAVRALKRSVDLTVGSLLAVIALPVIVLCALGCTASLHTWPFFVQRRIGKDGRLFPVPKLRTLPKSTPRAT